MAELKDSGERVQYEGGAMKEPNIGKGRMDLLPAKALLRLAVHFEDGARKYGDRNWENGMPKERFLDSGLRHLMQYMDGQTDEPHLVAATWNLLALLEYECRETKDGTVEQHDCEVCGESPNYCKCTPEFKRKYKEDEYKRTTFEEYENRVKLYANRPIHDLRMSFEEWQETYYKL